MSHARLSDTLALGTLLLVALFSFGVGNASELVKSVHTSHGTDESACAASEFRRLDFRLGAFNAETASGIRAGHDEAESILSGCGMIEHWTGAVSGHGYGLTVFDGKDGHWHMLFVNDAGNVLRLTGRFTGTTLVLTGDNYGFDGRYGLHRMSWSPSPSGGFRQLWELSVDRGRTWREIFDGRFTRIE